MVIGWGKIIQHGNAGWRAEFSRVVAIIHMVPAGATSSMGAARTSAEREVANNYGVPLITLRDLQRYNFSSEFGLELPGA